nr:uncharacterized protein LOC127294909 [Lolium perenne]
MKYELIEISRCQALRRRQVLLLRVGLGCPARQELRGFSGCPCRGLRRMEEGLRVSRPTRVGIHWSDMKSPNAHPRSPLLFLSALGHADACIVLVLPSRQRIEKNNVNSYLECKMKEQGLGHVDVTLPQHLVEESFHNVVSEYYLTGLGDAEEQSHGTPSCSSEEIHLVLWILSGRFFMDFLQ